MEWPADESPDQISGSAADWTGPTRLLRVLEARNSGGTGKAGSKGKLAGNQPSGVLPGNGGVMRDRPHFGPALVQLLMSAAFIAFLVMAALWSYQQTYAFTTELFGVRSVALALAGLIQFGQNFALFIKNRASTQGERTLWLVVFFVLVTLDFITNVLEFESEKGATWKMSTPTMTIIGRVFAYAVCFGVCFVEEILGKALGWGLHALNDMLLAMGKQQSTRLAWAEHAARGSSNMNPRQSGLKM